MSNPFFRDPKNWLILGFAILSIILGIFLFKGPAPAETVGGHEHIEAEATIWTCSMHPQIQLPEPGLCPLCGMDLIPLTGGVDESGDWELTLSPRARKLAEIQIAPVLRRNVPREIRMVGKVDLDEKRVGVISARTPGRIDRLFVDYTGIEVKKGDHMVELYSPDLVSAQQELRQALNSYQNGHASVRSAAKKRLEATREKLRLLGLSEAQIQVIENRETPSERLTIQAPMGGVVIQKHVNEGAYVKTGTPIYTVADLSRVWIKLDAYESDLAWLRYGQEVSFEVEAYPGETFKGRIVFIDPLLNPTTRTVKVRMDIPNPGGKLKPDMFVRAMAYAVLSPGGKVMDPGLAGKWISPMHPEIVQDEPGQCSVCGMDLVRAEELGFITDVPKDAPLTIPTSAALVTGERAVVYVTVDEEAGTFQGKEVVLGPRAGDYYVVKEGLAEGESVVVNGAFKIDSELQIRAKSSMMYRPTETSQTQTEPPRIRSAVSDTFREGLGPLLEAYFQIQDGLSRDTLHPAQQASATLRQALAAVQDKPLTGELGDFWTREKAHLLGALNKFNQAEDIADARAAFEHVSESLFSIVKTIGLPGDAEVFRFHCPMAFDNRGADWLQNHGQTANPYFGSAMFRCGSQVEQLHAKTADSSGEEGGHQHE